MVKTHRVVPNGWTRYSTIGEVIPNTRFIVFKTPLNERLLTKVPKKDHWTTLHLYRTLAERHIQLGLVIDLTDTTRYYDRKEFEGMCVDYEKIFAPGRGFVEREEVVDSFYSAVERFLSDKDNAELYIGVHCTHGVNRSGYLICRFLIEQLKWSSHEAIAAFEKARGFPIEKGAYVQALHRAAKDARSKKVKVDSDASDDSEVRQKKRKKERRRQMEDVEAQEMLQQFIGQISQHANKDLGTSATESPSNFDSPAQHSALSEGGQGEDDGDYAGEEGDDPDLLGPEEMSKSARRRFRKRKQEEMLKVMKRGNFHEIQEMINERFGGE
ncbi:unnamed protein product, partial [Mesorhabditis spiculigera]